VEEKIGEEVAVRIDHLVGSDPGLAIMSENNYLTKMCSGSEEGSYLRLTDFVYHSTVGLRVIKKKRSVPRIGHCRREIRGSRPNSPNLKQSDGQVEVKIGEVIEVEGLIDNLIGSLQVPVNLPHAVNFLLASTYSRASSITASGKSTYHMRQFLPVFYRTGTVNFNRVCIHRR